MEIFIQYAPSLLVIAAFFIQHRIFVTPEQLEKKHREIIDRVEARFATNQSLSALKEQLSDMKDKVNKIYDYIVNS